MTPHSSILVPMIRSCDAPPLAPLHFAEGVTLLKLGRAGADLERDADQNGPALKPEVEVGHKLCLAC